MKSPAESLNFRQSLLEFLEAGPGREEALLEEFERKKGQDDPLYSSLLYLLTHLDFTERQAARHWKRVVAHRDGMREALSRDPGLRVAVLDYFVNVSRELRNPKIIEIAMYERTERSAVSDGLTGLYNHAYLLQALRQEVLRSKRHGLKAGLLLLDLDDFKRVNDERGHVEGDRVLMKTASILRDSVREIDVAARYGGEEFAVLLPDTSRLGAFVVAERIRRRVEERFAHARTPVTLSGGIAVFPDDASAPADLIVQADAGLRFTGARLRMGFFAFQYNIKDLIERYQTGPCANRWASLIGYQSLNTLRVNPPAIRAGPCSGNSAVIFHSYEKPA